MLSVTLIEDDDAHAELFVLHLNKIEGLSFDITCFKTGSEAIKAIGSKRPDLLFVDYKLAGETGVDVITQLRSQGVNVPIIAITSNKDTYIAAEITRAGADDYLDKRDLSSENLVALLDRMLAIGQQRQQSDQDNRECAERLSTLTDREQDVLDQIMDGKTNKEIAADLHRSIKTIKVHRGRIMDKMQANTPAELAKFVLAGRGWRAASA